MSWMREWVLSHLAVDPVLRVRGSLNRGRASPLSSLQTLALRQGFRKLGMRAPTEVQPHSATPHSQKVHPRLRTLVHLFPPLLHWHVSSYHMNLQVVSPYGRYLVWTFAKHGAARSTLLGTVEHKRLAHFESDLPPHVMSTFTCLPRGRGCPFQASVRWVTLCGGVMSVCWLCPLKKRLMPCPRFLLWWMTPTSMGGTFLLAFSNDWT